ncbi:NADP-dependent isocitrate dehydrogenase [Paucihalobacter ruber]|uniref:Isocitrate dehydrogenase [NADP] n=1 Tax=Paucihalobacter ruber TaxID=2567861 RepID=A0A506PF94_9FLAO|nr:NADP-dependent isocitrate dehydrogenase [Paucihalobacter ruber]TPV32259.1 NADP-dependent isocitrate dehydrogenase [Paucihalobacter ruber]
MTKKGTIFYTKTDEAPALATRSLLPVVKAFTKTANINIELKDISLAGRIMAAFSDYLSKEQQQEDALTFLGELAKTKEANIIKLPNISASVPQLKTAIKELQENNYNIPDYPDTPANDKEREIKNRYDKIKGSAVNPVLREGNSDRRAPKAVKNFAKNNPHSMGAWQKDSKTHVATMRSGDFFHNEKSVTLDKATEIKIIFTDNKGTNTTLKNYFPILEGEIIDATYLSKNQLLDFLETQIKDAKEKNVLFSLHMKATMMKVSDPVIFGHAVTTYFKPVFEKYAHVFSELEVDPNNGFGNVLSKIETLPQNQKNEILKDINQAFNDGPDVAMVNSEKGITNLHVPSDVIIDASIPAMIRTSGKMWNKNGQLQDTKIVIPDSSYAGVYDATVNFCKENGAFDPTTMGTVPNVGLMAQKAEEYGSHDKTFEIISGGKVSVEDKNGKVIFEHQVEAGDIWRMCQVKDAPIKNWVELAVKRGKASGMPIVFWLDQNRAHDAQIITKVKTYLSQLNTDGVQIDIMSPENAALHTLKRVKEGKDTISVTGNVLRDYLTDLFPILEVGTSAKMLSIVPLMNGGGLFETGAGGSAPKHVEQFNQENHLRWDSLGEFLALAVSLEHEADSNNNQKAQILADALDHATEKLLNNGKSPSRKAGEIDNRGSHFYLSLYWAEALANQDNDTQLKETFSNVFKQLKENETQIISELNNIQGQPVDIAGYYFPNETLANNAMRPCELFNQIITNI